MNIILSTAIITLLVLGIWAALVKNDRRKAMHEAAILVLFIIRIIVG